MRVTLIEDDNGSIRYISPRIYILRPDPKHEGKYIAAGDATENFEVHRHIIKLTDTVYRDNTGMYCLTEAHPFFNVPIVIRAIVGNRLDNNLTVSHLTSGIRYLTKMALYAASAEYRKHK
jgi:hypothetical protein